MNGTRLSGPWLRWKITEPSGGSCRAQEPRVGGRLEPPGRPARTSRAMYRSPARSNARRLAEPSRRVLRPPVREEQLARTRTQTPAVRRPRPLYRGARRQRLEHVAGVEVVHPPLAGPLRVRPRAVRPLGREARGTARAAISARSSRPERRAVRISVAQASRLQLWISLYVARHVAEIRPPGSLSTSMRETRNSEADTAASSVARRRVLDCVEKGERDERRGDRVRRVRRIGEESGLDVEWYPHASPSCPPHDAPARASRAMLAAVRAARPPAPRDTQ